MSVGSYEASLRSNYIDAKRRLAGSPIRIAPRALPVPPPPPEPVRERVYRPIVRDIQYVLEDSSPGPFRWRLILEEVCAKHSVNVAQVLGRQRSQALVAARFETYYRLSQETTLSLPQIGRLMGGKDHTSVMHGIRKYKLRMEVA